MKSFWSILRWLPALSMMLVIFYFSSLPDSAIPDYGLADLLLKKGAHLLGFALLAFADFFALPVGWKPGHRRWLAFFLALLYAISDEIHQRFVPGRNGWWVDVVIDGLGAGAAMLLHWRYSNSSSRSSS